MTMRHVLCYALFILALANASASSAATIERDGDTGLGPKLEFSGPITRDDVARFRAALLDARRTLERPEEFVTVQLVSPGGDVYAAMEIGRLVRANDVHTKVQTTDIATHTQNLCVSACVFIFAAGVSRDVNGLWSTLLKHSAVGIHRPYYSGSESTSAHNADLRHKKMDADVRAYLKEMNLPRRECTSCRRRKASTKSRAFRFR
jgi:hypothetical protein